MGTDSMAPEKDGTGQKQADRDRGKGCVWSISTPWEQNSPGILELDVNYSRVRISGTGGIDQGNAS